MLNCPVYSLDKYEIVYLCKHTFLQFEYHLPNFVVKHPRTTVIRIHHNSILFACTNCHMFVVRTYKLYWLKTGDLEQYFQRCFLRKSKE